VVRLVARGALAGETLGPVGGVVLTEPEIGEAWSVAPFHGKEAAVGAALRKACGLGFPAPNTALAAGGVRALWSGRGRALVIGAPPPAGLGKLAAVTLQGDGIAALRVEGAMAETVLARLVPVDLRLARFPPGTTARSVVGHMAAQVTRLGPEEFEIMVMRSMGHTLVHEIRAAAEMVAARGPAAPPLSA
jgi:heterotetrameric sarcosine oxidase gamma subunit